MLPRTLLFSLGLASALFMTGCTITKQVDAVAPGKEIQKIWVAKNTNVHMEGLHPEVMTQLRALGFETAEYPGTSAPPPGAIHTLVYTANWQWDMAMYLTYFQATLMESGHVLGRVEYDARRGGGNMGKFGATAEKIRPMLIDLLSNVKRVPATTPALGSN